MSKYAGVLFLGFLAFFMVHNCWAVDKSCINEIANCYREKFDDPKKRKWQEDRLRESFSKGRISCSKEPGWRLNPYIKDMCGVDLWIKPH